MTVDVLTMMVIKSELRKEFRKFFITPEDTEWVCAVASKVLNDKMFIVQIHCGQPLEDV